MADYYCDHGAYGLTTNRIGLDAPAWGVPQEGDGASINAATASSVASIAFATVPTSGLMSVCGINIGTAGVIGAATVDAAANALAGLINAVTTTVAAGVAVGTPKLYNLVYARGPAGGAPAGTCQIMMRIGSTTLNQAVNSNAAIASTFDGSPTLVQFVGGTGGCWGWFINPVAMGVSSSIPVNAYGTWLYAPYVTLSANSIKNRIIQRTGGGASKTITATNPSGSANWTGVGNRIHIFDTNTCWTGDSAVGVLQMNAVHNVWGQNLGISVGNGGNCSLIALRNGGFELTLYANQQANISWGVGNGSLYLENIRVTSTSPYIAGLSVLVLPVIGVNINGSVRSKNCTFSRTVAAPTYNGLILTVYNATGCDTVYEGCTFNFPISGAGDPGPFLTTGNQAMQPFYRFSNCLFMGQTGLLTPYSAVIGNGNATNIAFENCTGLAIPSSLYGLQATTAVSRTSQRFFISKPNGDFRLEDKRGAVDWASGAGYPYLAAMMYGSNTPWTMRLMLVNLCYFAGYPTSTPQIRQIHTQATGVCTLIAEMFAPTALTFATGTVSCIFTYTDNTDIARSEASSLLEASSASWTNAGSYPTYSAKKIACVTTYPVLTGCEVTAMVYFSESPSSNQNEYVFVDPVVGVA